MKRKGTAEGDAEHSTSLPSFIILRSSQKNLAQGTQLPPRKAHELLGGYISPFQCANFSPVLRTLESESALIQGPEMLAPLNQAHQTHPFTWAHLEPTTGNFTAIQQSSISPPASPAFPTFAFLFSVCPTTHACAYYSAASASAHPHLRLCPSSPILFPPVLSSSISN